MPLAFIKQISTAFTDEELVAQYKLAGNMGVLGDLYQRYMELVYGVCLKYLQNADDAKDAVINIFEELVTKLKLYEVENFKGWLYQLAKNHCLMKIRSQKSKPVNVEIDIVQLADNVHLQTEIQKELDLNSMENCMKQLPDGQRAVVEMFYLQNKCYQQIADGTATDINKVRSFIQNGRRNLKICMEKQALQKAE